MQTIEFNKKSYPRFQSEGYASQFAIPYAKHICKGVGFDIGCGKEEWSFPGSIAIDPCMDDKYHAKNLPDTKVNYIFSSHCLEHTPDWVDVLDYWHEHLEDGGILFLYLPDYSQEYWRPWNNRKHVHILSAQIISDYMLDKKFKNIYSSGVDLNNSFMVFGEK